MGITHVIRGDDHLNNAFRQTQIYRALGWDVPEFAHLPLIHGPDGAKLSKRHGALGVDAYRDMGYLPEALRNYLLRLGWCHGDEEIIPTEQAIAGSSSTPIGRAPARFDFAKLDSVNGHYIREADDARLARARRPAARDAGWDRPSTRGERAGWSRHARPEAPRQDVARARRPRPILCRAAADRARRQGRALLDEAIVRHRLRALAPGRRASAAGPRPSSRTGGAARGRRQGRQARRPGPAAAGRARRHAPSRRRIFEVMAVLGREETLARLGDAAERLSGPSSHPALHIVRTYDIMRTI